MIEAALDAPPPFRLERGITIAGRTFLAKLWRTDPKQIGINLTALAEEKSDFPKTKAVKK
jgi:hypothetical protein